MSTTSFLAVSLSLRFDFICIDAARMIVVTCFFRSLVHRICGYYPVCDDEKIYLYLFRQRFQRRSFFFVMFFLSSLIISIYVDSHIGTLIYNNQSNSSISQNTNITGAIKCFDELIEKKMLVDPSLGYINKGVALRQLKRYDESLVCFDEVLKSKPDHLQALQYKSQVLADQHKFKEAISCIDEILKAQPGNVDFLRLKINYLNVSKDHEDALEACEVALQKDPDNLSVRIEQLLAQVNLNTTAANLGSDLRVSCDWFKEKKPELNKYQNRILGSALQQVGTYLNGTSEKENAIAYYNKAIEIHPTAVAYFNRGVSYNQLKKRKKALKSFEEAVKHDPEMHSCWSMIGMIYLMKKEYFKSMHAYVLSLSLSLSF